MSWLPDMKTPWAPFSPHVKPLHSHASFSFITSGRCDLSCALGRPPGASSDSCHLEIGLLQLSLSRSNPALSPHFLIWTAPERHSQRSSDSEFSVAALIILHLMLVYKVKNRLGSTFKASTAPRSGLHSLWASSMASHQWRYRKDHLLCTGTQVVQRTFLSSNKHCKSISLLSTYIVMQCTILNLKGQSFISFLKIKKCLNSLNIFLIK